MIFLNITIKLVYEKDYSMNCSIVPTRLVKLHIWLKTILSIQKNLKMLCMYLIGETFSDCTRIRKIIR